MACSPVGLISLMGEALCPVIAKFRFFFNRLGCLFSHGDHFHYHIFIRSSKNMSHFTYFHSCHSHHRVYYELTMACFPVSFISLMDRALRPVIAKARVRFQVKSKFFSGSFSTAYLGCLFDCEDHFHFHGISNSSQHYFPEGT